jgi:hypothetical protein
MVSVPFNGRSEVPRGDLDRQAEANQALPPQPHRQTVACPTKRPLFKGLVSLASLVGLRCLRLET